MLKQVGIADRDIMISPASNTNDIASSSDRPATGFWASVDKMFGGTDDHDTYAEGLRRGGTMLVAHVEDGSVDEAIDILEQHGSVDLSERETSWRQDGWTADSAITGGGVADTGAGPLRSMAAANDSKLAVASTVNQTTAAPPAVTSSAASTTPAVSGDALQAVEETLSVGKRAVNRGKVRLHSYVVETPVTETVNLREETVTIDRRPVDRALGAAELGPDAFKDRTIQMDEIDEEAVIAKNVRVVEEIGIRKDAKDEVRTVNDTVRSTKVEIEDERTTGSNSDRTVGVTAKLVKDMEVVGSDGQHVGLIDHVDGATIKLKRLDLASGGTHHMIPTDWVKTVDKKVLLETAASDAKARWIVA